MTFLRGVLTSFWKTTRKLNRGQELQTKMAKKISKSGSSSTDPLIQTRIVLLTEKWWTLDFFAQKLMWLEFSAGNRHYIIWTKINFTTPTTSEIWSPNLAFKRMGTDPMFSRWELWEILTLRIQICPKDFPYMCHGQARRYIGDGKPPTLIGNPYNGYINPYYWVDFSHPLLYGNGSLDPSTYPYFWGWDWDSTINPTIFREGSSDS